MPRPLQSQVSRVTWSNRAAMMTMAATIDRSARGDFTLGPLQAGAEQHAHGPLARRTPIMPQNRASMIRWPGITLRSMRLGALVASSDLGLLRRSR
jgi:hypothetical protein